MSTLAKTIAHEANQPPRLIRFKPRFVGGERERRMMTLTPDLHDWLHKAVRSTSLADIKARARSHFGEFVKGEPVDDLYFMKRVEDRRMTPVSFNHGVWSISPRFGEPQYRFFGAFVTQDWFLAICKQDRNRLEEHDNRWHEEIDKVLRTWEALFGTDLPYSGAQLQDYIRINAQHCDDRW